MTLERDDLIERLQAAFRQELAEHVGTLNGHALLLERGVDDAQRGELLRSLFRAAHSLKGASRAVSLPALEAACHRLEDLLGAARDERISLGSSAIQAIFDAADQLAAAGEQLDAGHDLDLAALDALSRRLAALAAGEPAAGGGAHPPQPAAAAEGNGRKAPQPTIPDVPGSSGPADARARAASAGLAAEHRVVGDAQRSAAERPQRAVGSDQVRIAAAKLDTLLSRSSVVGVAVQRIQSGEEGILALGESLRRMRRELQSLRGTLQCGGATGAASGVENTAAEAFASLERQMLATAAGCDRAAAEQCRGAEDLARAVGLLDEEIRRVRLLPFAIACAGLDRAVRDLARGAGKHVDLVLEGASVEIDRSVLEGLSDPIRALVRNAVDHGIEMPEERRCAGKPETGCLRLGAALHGDRVEITLEDDGRGIDVEAIRAIARERGLAAPQSAEEALNTLFEPGFSTAARLTAVSGRGVGLDIVRASIEGMHGTVAATSVPGRGMRFVLSLPLTLTTIRVVLAEVGGQILAIPSSGVVRLLRGITGRVRPAGGGRVLCLGGSEPIPIRSLAAVIGAPEDDTATDDDTLPIALVEGAGQRIALSVGEVVAERELLVKHLGKRLRGLRLFSGAAVLETGRAVLILSVAELIRRALAQGEPAVVRPRVARSSPERRPRILIADDSVTTRSLERSILECSGFEVVTSVDGEDAWSRLCEQPVDLVVSDVDMPRLSGLELCQRIRQSEPFRDLPVVLVTSLEAEDDLARGARAGANAYLVKRTFDQRDLVGTVRDLLGTGP